MFRTCISVLWMCALMQGSGQSLKVSGSIVHGGGRPKVPRFPSTIFFRVNQHFLEKSTFQYQKGSFHLDLRFSF
jgi:hypothetical protein